MRGRMVGMAVIMLLLGGCDLFAPPTSAPIVIAPPVGPPPTSVPVADPTPAGAPSPTAAPTAQPAGQRTIPELLGGGNAWLDDGADTKFRALNTVGARVARVPVFPRHGDGWASAPPRPEDFDGLMRAAHQRGITPYILFEYYVDSAGFTGVATLGGYDEWYENGRAFAARFAPGGEFQRQEGIADGWGATMFSAINEPDGPRPGDPKRIPDGVYRDALKGLADGVHSVDPTLKVLPGGFLAPNRDGDYTLNGLGPVIAPLLNDGTLAGIDIHTYMDRRYAPLEGTYEHSAQDDFDRVKKESGITADIDFFATEFNFALRPDQGYDENGAAQGLLTSIWDNLGVVKNDGSTSATQVALAWNIFNTAAEDPEYGLNTRLDPWTPTARGRVLQMVAQLTADMSFVALDPKGAGTYVLEGGGKKLWVWQNRQGWTDQPGRVFAVTGIPAGATTLEVHGWDGLRQTVAVDGRDEVTFEDLPVDETLMFLARSGA